MVKLYLPEIAKVKEATKATELRDTVTRLSLEGFGPPTSFVELLLMTMW
jgi:hypothetical protein